MSNEQNKIIVKWNKMGIPLTPVKTSDYYLDEFTFRFNRRRSKARRLLFHRLAQQAVAVDPAPYSSIVYGKPALRG